VIFDSKNLTEACYKCEHCGGLWRNGDKAWFLPRGHWIAKKPLRTNCASFHLSSLYSPWLDWTTIAQEFLAAAGDPARMQVWTNTKLAESFENQAGETIYPNDLMLRREKFGDALPAGVVALTAGVDVQDNRLEVEIVGWGANE
jgi:phage terminase large subunit GpA-like protein